MEGEDILLYGASGHGRVVAEIAEDLGIEVRGFIDDNPDVDANLGYAVAASLAGKTKGNMVVSIGNNAIRRQVVNEYPGFNYLTLISPKANISKRAVFGEGTVVMSGVTVNSLSVVGRHCIINTNASVGHDCVLGDFVHISPNVALAGGVSVGAGTQIGTGTCVIPCVRIGENCTIGAGSVVVRNIPDNALVMGNPGRVVRYKTP